LAWNNEDVTISPIFDPSAWREVPGFSFTDITYHRAVDQGTVRVAFNRPEVRNAFRPHTVDELVRHRKMVAGHFVAEATNAFVAKMATSMQMATHKTPLIVGVLVACIFWKYNALFGSCQKL
jgi:hypothetical protein